MEKSRPRVIDVYIRNGDFSAGNVEFETDYTHRELPVKCVNAGDYAIGTNANDHHNGWSGLGPGGTGLFLMANGHDQPNKDLWRQQVHLNAGEKYFFAFLACNIDGNPDPEIQAFVDGNAMDEGGHAILVNIPNQDDWVEVTGMFVAQSDDVTLHIRALSQSTWGNDVAITNIRLQIGAVPAA